MSEFISNNEKVSKIPMPKVKLEAIEKKILKIVFDEVESRLKKQKEYLKNNCENVFYFDKVNVFANDAFNEIETLIYSKGKK